MAGKPRSKHLTSKTVEEWAFLIWPYLLAAASNRQTINYSELSALMNWGGPSGTGRVLGRILDYCASMKKGRTDYPLLPCIVVNYKTGRPGDDELYADINLDEMREKVYKFNWYEVPLPSPENFK